VIPEKKMIDVLYDIQLAQAVFRSNSQFSLDEKKDALVESIYAKHKITQAELDSSLVWYSDNVQYYMAINDSVAARLRASSERLTALKNEMNSRMRNWSNYIIPPFFYLSEATPTLSFKIDSMKIKTVDLPKFNIGFDVQGMNDNQVIEAAVFFDYKDTLVKKIIPVDGNTRYILSKPQLADSLLKGISGYIHMQNKVKGIPNEVMLYNISYSDSLSIDNDSLTGQTQLSPTRNSSDLKVVPVARPNNATDADKMKTRERAIEGAVQDEAQKRDNAPVLSKEEVERSPVMRRSRSSKKVAPEKAE